METDDTGRHLAYDQNMPPDYADVVSSTRYPILRASGSDPEGVSAAVDSWRLKFADFTPHLSANSQSTTMLTSFEKIIDRANTWLRGYRNADVITCETVTWCAEDLRQLNKTDVTRIKFKKGNLKKMFFMRGLRVWLTPRRVFSDDQSTTICVREFTADVADVKSLENFDIKLLIQQANRELSKYPISGRIINIDTALRPTRVDCSDDKLSPRVYDTFWTDGATINRKYIPVVRVFYEKRPRIASLEIGVRDVLPRIVREAGKQKHEDLEAMMAEASLWIQTQKHITVTNIQTVTYRKRGFTQGVGLPVFWASTDGEDACLRCLRIAYTKPKMILTLGIFPTNDSSIRKRTFAPRRTKTPAESGSSGSPDGDDSGYQSFTRTVDEISRWLGRSEEHLLCVETLHQPLHDGRPNSSPDGSIVRQTDEKTREFLTLVRVYLRTSSTSSDNRSSPSTSVYEQPAYRPLWARANQRAARGHVTTRRTHVVIICVISAAILIASTVIVLVIAVGRRWI